MTKTLLVKNYTNENLKYKAMSIWITYKNLLVTLVSVVFA